MATPWSPPAWMKTGRSLTGSKGGILRPSCYGAYARYFVKFIEAYAQQGIPVSAVTVQNEPNYAPETYPGMKMGAVQQVDFINNHLGPAFEAAGISTKILCYDHNWDNAAYAKTVLTARGGMSAVPPGMCMAATFPPNRSSTACIRKRRSISPRIPAANG